MAELRFRIQHMGGHVHARVFATEKDGGQLTSVGTLVMRKEEWKALQAVLLQGMGADGTSVYFEGPNG
jgi:hypothetical protein